MKRFLLSVAIVIFPLLVSAAQDGNMLRYEKNKGQWDNDILYRCSFLQGHAYLLKDRMSIVVFDSTNPNKHTEIHKYEEGARLRYSVFSVCPYKGSMSQPVAKNQQNGITNYFLGNDKSRWASKVPSFENVTYPNVYPNVDWEISSCNKMPKYSYIVRPNGDVGKIKTLYRGAKNVFVRDNRLYIQTETDIVAEDELFVYQKQGDSTAEITSSYKIESVTEGYLVSYVIGSYDKAKDLTIDPGIVMSTYSGSYSDNWGMASCFDKKLLMISGGVAEASGYITTEGAYDTVFHGNWDCVITKYDSLGQNMIFSTYLGGINGEMPHSMIVNNNNEVVIFGTTGSEDFPVTDNAYQKKLKGGDSTVYDNAFKYPKGIDIFITTLSSDGSSIISSTYLGGSGNDGLNFRHWYSNDKEVLRYGNDSLYYNYGDGARGEIITDKNNNVYVATCTFSDDFPTTTNAFQQTSGGLQDAVVFKFNRELSSLIFSTYLGGGSNDAAYSIDIDTQNSVYICGGTSSYDFPTSAGAYNPTYNGGQTDAFLSVLSGEGTLLKGSTYFGSNNYDQAFFVRLDDDCYPYIYGQTKAKGTQLIYKAQYNKPNSGQFVTKFSSDLQERLFSTVFGTGDGQINLSPSGFAVDRCQRIYCAGWGREFKYMKHSDPDSYGTTGMDITSDALQTNTDGMDFYIMLMNANASSLDYATFFGEVSSNATAGNDHVDGGTSRFDRFGNFYLTECASCGGTQGYPTTPNAFSSSNNSKNPNCNMTSTKISIRNDFAVADFGCNDVNCKDAEITFHNYSRGDSFVWDFGDGSPKVTTKEPNHAYQSAGAYKVTLIANLEYGCKISDTISRTILVLDNSSKTADSVWTCPNAPVNLGFDNFSLSSGQSVSFLWTPSEYLSDSTSPSPYAKVDKATLFRLVIKTDECFDTIYKYVGIDSLQSETPDTLNYCKVPYYYRIPNEKHRIIECSFQRDFSSVVKSNGDSVLINNADEKYLYLRLSANGCNGLDSVMLNYTGPKPILQITNEGCSGEKHGKAVAECNYDKPIHYKWSATSEDVPVIDNLAKGEYSLYVSDEDGCGMETTFRIDATENVNLNLTKTDASCMGVCNGMIIADANAGKEPYEYAWSNGETTQTVQNLCGGDYNVIVTDANGCSQSAQTTIENVYKLDDFSAWADEYVVYDGHTVHLSSVCYDGFEYSWRPSEHLSNPTSCQTNATVYESTTFTATVKNSEGCYKSDTVNIEVVYIECGKPNIFIPNAFTPNNDGKNDVLSVSGEYVNKFELSIYDRWGERVYHSTDINESWDGTFRNQDCAAGVYFYKLEITCTGGKTFLEGGDITLIR